MGNETWRGTQLQGRTGRGDGRSALRSPRYVVVVVMPYEHAHARADKTAARGTYMCVGPPSREAQRRKRGGRGRRGACN